MRPASPPRRFLFCARLALLASFVAAMSLSTALPAEGGTLVALWHMNERSGSVMHDSAGRNNGTIRRVSLGRPGFKGTAFGFDGSASRVDVPSSTGLNPGSSNFTVRAHVKLPNPPARDSYDLVRKGVCCKQFWKMEIHRVSGVAKASCRFRGSNRSLALTQGPKLDDGRWHTIVCEKRSSSIRLIVDGRAFSLSGSVGSITNTARLTVGYKADYSDWYKGTLDEVSIVKG